MPFRPFSRRPALVALVLYLTLPTAWAVGINDAVDLALDRDEGLKSMQIRLQATGDRAIAEGALPDPQLFIGAEGIPIDDPAGADMMTMYMLGIRQEFPPGRTRQLSSARARSEGAIIATGMEARRLDIMREVRLAWLDWATAAAVIEVAEEGLEAFSGLLELTEARYRAGTGRQRDIDQARLERSLLARRIIDARTGLDEAASDLARWTGTLPSEPPTAALPEWEQAPELEKLSESLARHPAVQEDLRRMEAGQIATELARQAYRPMWMVEAGYGHQRGASPMGGRMSDKLFGMVSFSLPLFTANRQDRSVAAAQAEVDALHHQRLSRLQEWEGRARNQLTTIGSQQRRLELLEDIILPEARRTLESTFRAYRTDRASFDELVRARLGEIDQTIESIETRQALLRARVELAYLTAEELP
jgi:cobalt-zinc-cadmium efflux system outer membrane protein